MWLIDGPIGTAAGQPCSAIWGSARVNIVTEPSHLFHSLLVLYHTTGTSPPKHTHKRGNTESTVQVFPFVILSVAHKQNDVEGTKEKVNFSEHLLRLVSVAQIQIKSHNM